MVARGPRSSAATTHILDVHESQQVFMILLRALSFPGRVQTFPPALVARVAPATLPLLALLGHGSTCAIVGEDKVRDAIAFATGARVGSTETASHVMFADPHTRDILDVVSSGSALSPETGAQVSVRVNGTISTCATGSGTIALEGPGVEDRISVLFSDPPVPLLVSRIQPGWVAPCGVDIWCVADDGSIVGIPRTARVSADSLPGLSGQSMRGHD